MMIVVCSIHNPMKTQKSPDHPLMIRALTYYNQIFFTYLLS